MRDFEWNMCGTAGSHPSSLWPPSGHLLAALMSTSKCLALENINLFLFPPVVSPESFRWVFLVSLQLGKATTSTSPRQPHPLNTYTHTHTSDTQTIIAPYWSLAQSFNSIDSIGIVSVFYVHFAPTLSHISQLPVARSQFSLVHFQLHIVVVAAAAPECLIYLQLEKDSLAAAASFCSLLKKENVLRAWESTEPFAKI